MSADWLKEAGGVLVVYDPGFDEWYEKRDYQIGPKDRVHVALPLAVAESLAALVPLVREVRSLVSALNETGRIGGLIKQAEFTADATRKIDAALASLDAARGKP